MPIEPEWKREYAASVRRLVRDGVDVQLADLFAQTAVLPSREVTPGARSSSEQFLYRRLDTLQETRGLFHLNRRLPIPFAGRGTTAVDFFCPEARLVIELDGDQHLADAEAYRRDRQKDYLLQEHGYLVLRFLAVDLGRHLDDVIDTILRALAHQRRNRGSS